MMSLIGQSEAVLKRYNLDSLISQSLDYMEYNPSKAVYTDLISSGKLNLISSDSLRLLLFEWSIRLDEKIEEDVSQVSGVEKEGEKESEEESKEEESKEEKGEEKTSE